MIHGGAQVFRLQVADPRAGQQQRGATDRAVGGLKAGAELRVLDAMTQRLGDLRA